MKHVNVVCAIIINDNNEVFCCKRSGDRLLSGYWEFPGGKIEENETYEETIVREIKEELDTIVKPVKYLGEVYHEYNDIDKPFSINLHGYLCEVESGDLTLLEHEDSKWLKKEDLYKLKFAEADIPFIDLLK